MCSAKFAHFQRAVGRPGETPADAAAHSPVRPAGRRRCPVLTTRALRSFIFHPNQWLVLKAVRQAPARPAYTRRPRCTADIFSVTLRGGGKTFFAAFRCALFALDGNARNQAVRRSTGSRAFASGRGIMSLINYNVNGACRFIMWRRPQTLRRDLPHDARLLVSRGLGSEFNAFFGCHLNRLRWLECEAKGEL